MQLETWRLSHVVDFHRRFWGGTELRVGRPPKRPARVWRRRAAYPQRWPCRCCRCAARSQAPSGRVVAGLQVWRRLGVEQEQAYLAELFHVGAVRNAIAEVIAHLWLPYVRSALSSRAYTWARVSARQPCSWRRANSCAFVWRPRERRPQPPQPLFRGRRGRRRESRSPLRRRTRPWASRRSRLLTGTG